MTQAYHDDGRPAWIGPGLPYEGLTRGIPSA